MWGTLGHPEDMWPDFADCMCCVSENDHREHMDHESDASDPDCDPAAEDPLPEAKVTFGEAVEANAFFAEVATTTPAATDVDDTPTKIFNGFGQPPNFMHTDDHGLFKLAWEAKGWKFIKGP